MESCSSLIMLNHVISVWNPALVCDCDVVVCVYSVVTCFLVLLNKTGNNDNVLLLHFIRSQKTLQRKSVMFLQAGHWGAGNEGTCLKWQISQVSSHYSLSESISFAEMFRMVFCYKGKDKKYYWCEMDTMALKFLFDIAFYSGWGGRNPTEFNRSFLFRCFWKPINKAGLQTRILLSVNLRF